MNRSARDGHASLFDRLGERGMGVTGAGEILGALTELYDEKIVRIIVSS